MSSCLRLLLLVVILASLAATCERPFDLEIEEPDPQLVVISKFTNDRNVLVQVSRSQSILDEEGQIDYILDARVDLYQRDNFLEQLELIAGPDQINPYFTTREFRPAIGTTYTIRVEASGFDPVTATSEVPPQVKINRLLVRELQVDPGEKEYQNTLRFTVELVFEDPPAKENFYHLNLFQNIQRFEIDARGDTIPQGMRRVTVDFNSLVDNNYKVANFDGGMLLEDTPFDGRQVTLDIPLAFQLDRSNERLGKILVELRAVSEDYYLFKSTLSKQQRNPGQPFSEPVIVYNNVQNGQGIFAGYSASLDSVAVHR